MFVYRHHHQAAHSNLIFCSMQTLNLPKNWCSHYAIELDTRWTSIVLLNIFNRWFVDRKLHYCTRVMNAISILNAFIHDMSSLELATTTTCKFNRCGKHLHDLHHKRSFNYFFLFNAFSCSLIILYISYYYFK